MDRPTLEFTVTGSTEILGAEAESDAEVTAGVALAPTCQEQSRSSETATSDIDTAHDESRSLGGLAAAMRAVELERDPQVGQAAQSPPCSEGAA